MTMTQRGKLCKEGDFHIYWCTEKFVMFGQTCKFYASVHAAYENLWERLKKCMGSARVGETRIGLAHSFFILITKSQRGLIWQLYSCVQYYSCMPTMPTRWYHTRRPLSQPPYYGWNMKILRTVMNFSGPTDDANVIPPFKRAPALCCCSC